MGGLPPCNDGGFDDILDDGLGRAIQSEALPGSAAPGRGEKPHHSERTSSPKRTAAAALPPRAPATEAPPSSTPPGSGGSLKSRGRNSASGGSGGESSLGKTCTPVPGSLQEMLGEASASAAVRHSSGGPRPRSGSRQRSAGKSDSSGPVITAGINKERSLTPKKAAGALDFDPLGNGQQRRRF